MFVFGFFYLFNLRTDIMYLYVGEKLTDVLFLQKHLCRIVVCNPKYEKVFMTLSI